MHLPVLFQTTRAGRGRGLATLAALLLAGCRAGNTIAPRTPPLGMPAKLIPAPVEQHPRATPHSL
jgi:hypothetical protein